jgi:DNA-binding transcriptional regulator PaaX
MGTIEQGSRKRTQKERLKKVILGTIKTAGLLAIAVAAPNVVGAMSKLGMLPSKRQNEVVRRSCEKFVRSGLLQKTDVGFSLTKKGEAALRMLEIKESKTDKRRWDGKWRMLIFDVPEYRRGLREKIRRTLRMIGFAHLQDSVWIYPYDCEDLVALLKADFRIGKDILYVIADAVEGDFRLKRRFKLPE